MIRHFFHIFLAVFLFFGILSPSFTQEKTSIRKVVIDAGHGGKDPGAIGRKAKEKNITLTIALKLSRLIRENLKDVDVILTRDSDVFVELYQRAEIANRNKADLFISIHCNSNPSRVFQGAETYVMGLNKSKQNLEISKLENSSILMEPDYLSRYDGFDPGSDESYITFTLFQNAYLNQSTEFAAEVQNEMKDRVGMDDRGVRQAGFLVLYKTTMPAVLIETGFLSNPVEESYLLSETGQDHIANAIFRSLITYKERLEKTKTTNILASKEMTGRRPDNKPIKRSENNPENKPVPAKQKKEIVKPVEESGGNKKAKNDNSEDKNCNIWFCVQIATSSSDIGVDNKKFSGLPKVSVYQHGGLYKYIVGNEKEVAKALDLTKELRRKGFKGAFVVAFNGNERITVEEARHLIDKQKGK
jgi:N-acetylmuramoyl-L-alanine amidase